LCLFIYKCAGNSESKHMMFQLWWLWD